MLAPCAAWAAAEPPNTEPAATASRPAPGRRPSCSAIWVGVVGGEVVGPAAVVARLREANLIFISTLKYPHFPAEIWAASHCFSLLAAWALQLVEQSSEKAPDLEAADAVARLRL